VKVVPTVSSAVEATLLPVMNAVVLAFHMLNSPANLLASVSLRDLFFAGKTYRLVQNEKEPWHQKKV